MGEECQGIRSARGTCGGGCSTTLEHAYRAFDRGWSRRQSYFEAAGRMGTPKRGSKHSRSKSGVPVEEQPLLTGWVAR